MSSEDQLRKDAAKLRDEINNVIKDLKGHHFGVNVAKTVSSTVSVFGGVLFVGAALLAVPTGGLSLMAAGAGAAFAGVGGAGSVTASCVEYIIEKRNISGIQENWEKFQNDLEKHFLDKYGCLNTVRTIFKYIGRIIKRGIQAGDGYRLIRDTITREREQRQINNAWGAAVNAERAAANAEEAAVNVEIAMVNAERAFNVVRVAVNVGVAAEVAQAGRNVGNAARVGRAALQGIKAVGKASFVLNTVMLPLNVIDLVHSISALNGDQSSDASNELERMADFLDRVANNKL
ncbi:uncharacterized protein LOC112567233 [Pomacea canaliculata]|uniref:uncharacterized protein LOC112567233 n=1 Tax=Pomacea canaliculata TaxID=400727 RepID=UPI000D733BA9|nr:uncharacterized protein LOC112567233 [Pomacea canaliculata]XP_025099634.1 uncharacterized protein LOC112567233 [Pomacea canaliculata]XP_025099635.1 uncharacterized protein LOC112567233 [Pomacea canaliculata]